MDNLQWELQLLQVENKRLREDEQSGGVCKEMEDLRQRFFEAEERALGAEQEAEQWRAEVEQLKETLETRQEGEETKEALTEQLAAKTTLVEQLTKRGSEHQLELDSLHAQNKLLSQLQSRISESARQVHGTEASISEASLHSATITSDVAGLTLGTYSSPSRPMGDADTTELPTPVLERRDSVSLNIERVHTGLNVSATLFPLLFHPVGQRSATASGTSPSTHTQAAAYDVLLPPLVPLKTPVLSGSHLSMHGSTVPGSSIVMHTGANQPLVNHTSNQVQPAGNAAATTERGCVEVAPMSFQVPPVPKYTGNAEVEPFDEWLEQFELVASFCRWEGRAKLANLVTHYKVRPIPFIAHVQFIKGPPMKHSRLH